MRHGWDHGKWAEEDDERPAGRRGHRPRKRKSKRDELAPEERMLRDARRRANARIGFHFHLIAWATTCLCLVVVAGFRPALIVALCWGIGLASHYFAAVAAPGLRRRYVEREVHREMQHSAPRERRSIEDKHVKSLEELSASIAHEIRNPITAAKSLVQQMGEDPAAVESVEYAKVALDELDRVERSVAHLLRYARDEELRMTEVDLADVMASAVETFRERAARAGAVLETEFDSCRILRADPEKLRRVFINLIGNALDSLEAARTPDPRIQIAMGENLAATECWVRVCDNGPGIDPELLRKVFSPFYTSKESGTGLGLALSRKVMEAHGGSIEASSTPGAGAEFTLTLPRQAARS